MKPQFVRRKLNFTRVLLTAFVGLRLAVLSSPAQEVNALIDTLVDKKLLTPKDAEKVRKGLAEENAHSVANRIKLADNVTELRLWGDLRLRYQYDQAQAQAGKPSTVTSTGGNPSDAALGFSPNTNQRSRERFRLRLGADLKMGESFFGGFSLATGQTADSNNETFTSGFDNYNIYINRVFLGWKAAPWATFIAGKQDNPLYTTDLVWDPDIMPQGVVEKIDVSKALFPDGSNLAVSLVAGQFIFFDNDEFRRAHAAGTDAWLFSQQLQTTYKAEGLGSITVAPGLNLYNAARLSGLRNTRAFSDVSFQNFTPAVQTQVLTTTTVQTTIEYDAKGIPTVQKTPVNVQTATTITSPSGGNLRTVTANGTAQQVLVRDVGTATAGLPQYNLPVNKALANRRFVSSSSSSSGSVSITNPQPNSIRETADLAILTVPGDLSFKLGPVKTKLYWDVAYNLRGRDRFNKELGLDDPIVIDTQDPKNPVILTTRQIYGQHYEERDSLAWLIGLQLGENRKRGDVSLLANYRETGVAAVDPNLNDSDIALSALNTKVIQGRVSYNITDWLAATATYSHATSLHKDLIGGQATNGAAIADLKSVDVFQVDLNWKF